MMNFIELSRKMIDRQIAGRGITNRDIIAAFNKVPRHFFVPEDLRKFAYEDGPLRIGYGQTISQPYIVALMIDLLSIENTDLILEIGTGSGYQTAILAELSKAVYTIERIEDLTIYAKIILNELGYTNILYQVGDGTKGWTNSEIRQSSFNKIIVSAAAPSVPPSLIAQLAEGGRLVIPAGNKVYQELLVIEKQEGKLYQRQYGGCTFVPLIGEEGWSID